MSKEEQYFLINAQILPEAIKKTAIAKEMLTKNEVSTINEAVERVGLSRSTYYKYKDGVFPINTPGSSKISTINLILQHKLGILSEVINLISENRGNILTVNQSIPIQGVANVTISFETSNTIIGMEEFLKKLNKLGGVKQVDFVSNI